MGKAKKKTAISKKEEQQAQKVVKIVFCLINYFGIGNVGCILLFRLIDSLQIT